MTIEDKFARAEQSGQDSVFERIDESHPVGIYLGLEDRQRAIMILCKTQPPQPPHLVSIAIDVRMRQPGEWALVLRLVRSDLRFLFTRLVEDLEGATRQGLDQPGSVVMQRLARWQRLLSKGPPGVLDDDALRGLLCELDFLVHEAVVAVGPRAAVAAWRGPYEGPKDFVFDGAEVEVKSTHRQRDRLLISSLAQLSDAGVPLSLWCRVAEVSVVDAGDPRSASVLVGRAREAVAADPVAADDFEQCLRLAGWVDRDDYARRGVSFGEVTCYAVSDDFPRLQRAQVPEAIAACRYEVLTERLRPFVVQTWRRPELRHGR